MSNLWAMRGIKKMLMDKQLNKPRLKHRSYQLKSRSWMRRLTAADNKIERLETERDEYRNAILGMSAMLKNSEWANLLSTNDVIAELDIQITELHSDHSKLLNQRNELLKSLELMLDEDDGGMAAEQARQTIIRIEGGKS